MTYTEAQKEFQIRLYHWAQAAQEKEIREDFPNFRYFDEEFLRRFIFYRSLDPDARKLLAKGLIQSCHQEAVKFLGESISLESHSLMNREESFRMRQLPGTWEGQFAPKNEADQPTKATRQQFKKAIRSHFRAAFGSTLLPPDPLNGKSELVFPTKCRGWIINTQIEFVGRWGLSTFQSHSIWTGKWITKEEPAVLFANCIGFGLQYGGAIGIGSIRREILAENIEPTCAEIITHCRIMFDALPTLLEGLELESLTT